MVEGPVLLNNSLRRVVIAEIVKWVNRLADPNMVYAVMADNLTRRIALMFDMPDDCIRIIGREGTVTVTLLVGPAALDTVENLMAEYYALLKPCDDFRCEFIIRVALLKTETHIN